MDFGGILRITASWLDLEELLPEDASSHSASHPASHSVSHPASHLAPDCGAPEPIRSGGLSGQGLIIPLAAAGGCSQPIAVHPYRLSGRAGGVREGVGGNEAMAQSHEGWGIRPCCC
ncbi:hypothetical protein [Bifidobacterium psychraerophilum]|uniref:Uncharacterized protein n=1 Tax=Bifidobacterium psychraerophilum TaxID=218140 RepID=A0A087CCT4_9BIFI|nr:hypothetical protein [Bifidobacterium psychraerophilum]KFI81084.1 hypothetical protein BPSY_1489 [Bifidobacterium psychraerophilum]PKA95427.1 hypothetical protein A9A89_1692 [Bifidobacterium psychraerophilum DSM 22366]